MRLFLLLSFASFAISGFCQEFPRYSSVLDRNDLDILEANPKVSFDKMGIIKYDGKYDPDLVLEYGLLCHDRYKKTGDSAYLLKLDEQAQFVLGGKSDHMIFGVKIGGSAVRLVNDTLDVSAPRYSARTQGLALSLVVRYNTEENEDRLRKHARSHYLVLTADEEKGGCLSRIGDGSFWLEEFPGSSVARHSLKGMLIGVIGLIEYSIYQDDDLRLKRFVEDAIRSLKQRLVYYHDLNKVYASENIDKAASVGAQRDLIFLMKHLYELTGDPVFLREMGIIATLMGHQSSENVHEWEMFYSNAILVEGKIKKNMISPVEVTTHLTPQERVLEDNGTIMTFPWYTYTLGERVVNKEPSVYELTAPEEQTDFHVLYRYHWDPDLFEKEPWNAVNGTSGSKHSFQMAPGYYQFMTLSRGLKEDFELITNELRPLKK